MLVTGKKGHQRSAMIIREKGGWESREQEPREIRTGERLWSPGCKLVKHE
jgi:hypothetical protein